MATHSVTLDKDNGVDYDGIINEKWEDSTEVSYTNFAPNKPEYIKTDKEDLNSIANGISGQKGLVNLNIGSPINFIDNSYEACANLISRSILDLYELQPSNFAACQLQNIKYTLDCNFSKDQINFAKDYLENRTRGLEPGIKALLLQQYSNPVIQKEAL